jgi:hypothetical protein
MTCDTSERAEYERVCSLLRQCACAVYRLSQPRASGQTPGVPDLLAFSPKRGLAFVEVKRPDGKGRQSLAQMNFEMQCRESGETYILGGVTEVANWLQGGA